MDAVLINQATDILNGTLPQLVKRKPFMTYAYTNYGLLNDIFNGRVKVGGGDEVKWFCSLGDENNARHRGNWDEDTHNVLNVQHAVKAPWVRASTNLSYNMIEQDMNSGPAAIYDVIDSKYDNCLRELSDEMYKGIVGAPTSSTDKYNPQGLPCWFSIGTNGSTGGWTGYSAHYNDGSTPGDTYDIGGIASSASSNARWGSYYADHDGDLDESLLSILDTALRKLNFEGPMHPRALDDTGRGAGKFSMYSNDNVIRNINALLAKSDDQAGFRINSHYANNPVIKGVEIKYVAPLDTANVSTFGTDPIFGVNKDMFFPVMLNRWDFKIGKPRQRDNQAVVMTVDIDVVYAYKCLSRQFGGFLINAQ